MKLPMIALLPLAITFSQPLVVACGVTNSSDSKRPTEEQPASEGKPAASGDSTGPQSSTAKTLVQLLQADSRFSTLVAAVQAAGLVETLSGSSPFTVFAPSNKAFEALPPGTVESLLKPENKDTLKSILLYHVAPGSLKASSVLASSSITTAQGKSVSVDAKNAKINMSGIVKTDIVASNGVIHEIDAVLLPPDDADQEETSPTQSIAGTLADNPRFSTLVAAVKAAGLLETLAGSTKFTVFAPSNAAFAALPEGTVEFLLKPENKETLKGILLYHVAPGSLQASDVLAQTSITSAQGQSVSVDAKNALINMSKIVKTDIFASNGVIHEIDTVLLPPTEDKDTTQVPSQNLVEILAAQPKFSILVAAVKAAGLESTLSGASPFTIFAPSNAAFEALPHGTLEALLKPENKETLKSILLYHVAAGALKAEDVLAEKSIKTAQGQCVVINAMKAKVDMAFIVATDILAKNGVIHEIDSVLIPNI